MSASHAWGGALTALGGLTLLGGVSVHQRCSTPPGATVADWNCGQPLVNPATVVGAAGTGLGIFMLTRPEHSGGRHRLASGQPRTRSRAARRAGMR